MLSLYFDLAGGSIGHVAVVETLEERSGSDFVRFHDEVDHLAGTSALEGKALGLQQLEPMWLQRLVVETEKLKSHPVLDETQSSHSVLAAVLAYLDSFDVLSLLPPYAELSPRPLAGTYRASCKHATDPTVLLRLW